MIPIEKWPGVRAALLVMTMLMWWLPMPRSQQQVYPRLVQPFAGKQSGSAAYDVAGGASQASGQATCKTRYCFRPFPRSLARNSRALRPPSILARLHGGSSERNGSGQRLGLSQS